ncbi:MAG: RNA methyltransferase [Anaerolineae bacterium]|nr:RNA methyltransferase [Anaerolineae bacterium]
MPLISSPHNDRIKLVRLLQRQSKTRRREHRLVLEGVRLVHDALDTGALPDFVCYTGEAAAQNTALHDLIAGLEAERVSCLEVTEALMRDMSDTETPQGILGVFPWPDLPIPEPPSLVLVADGWRDPGNLGTMLRSAAGAGIDLVILTPGTVDPFNPKTLRAGMGAHFRVPVRVLDWSALASTVSDLSFYLADAAGETAYDAVDWTQPAVIVVGGEAHGFTTTAHAIPHTRVRIPMAAGVESLNAAVAASILVYEARRQR